LALGLALSGVALSLRRRSGLAVAVFCLAALTKEIYVLVPLSVAAWHLRERRRGAAVSIAVLPLLPLLAWSVWVWLSIPESPDQVRHVGPPGIGILNSAFHWKALAGRNNVQLFLAAYALFSLAVATVMLALGRNLTLRWVAAPWILMALCATAAVWKVPGNAARALSILWPVAMLLLVERLRLGRASQSEKAPE
jgi:hypothetical protein